MNRTQIALRAFIIFFWLAIIAAFLILPGWWPTKSATRTINVFSWTELIDGKKIAEFEERTGINVNIGYYENNEELYAKVKITNGEGYDLLMPTEYMVDTLIQEKLLQKIDRKKLPFWNKLDPRLLDLYADPKNQYSIPYLWSMYGIGVNKSFFAPGSQIPESWRAIFDPTISTGPRTMLEDPRELILVAAFYLFGSDQNINEQKMQAITKLLVDQKKYVLAYGDYTAPYVLASGQVALALVATPYILRILPENDDLSFILPDEGTFAMIESFVIPAASTKQDLVYEFINFLYEPEVMQYHADKTCFFPSRQDVPAPDMAYEKYQNFQFFRNIVPEEMVNEFWLLLKSA